MSKELDLINIADITKNLSNESQEDFEKAYNDFVEAYEGIEDKSIIPQDQRDQIEKFIARTKPSNDFDGE